MGKFFALTTAKLVFIIVVGGLFMLINDKKIGKEWSEFKKMPKNWEREK